MSNRIKFMIIILLVSFSATLGFVNTNYMKWKDVQQLENTRQVGLVDIDYDYVESDNPLFYSSSELASYMIEDIQSNVEQETPEDTLALIKEICPYVEIDETGIRVPTSSPTASTQTKPTPTQKVDTEKQVKYQKLIDNLMKNAEECLGTPYVWGGTKIKKGMDCSGFVQYIYKQIGFTLPRVSKDQSKVGKLVKRNALKPGDLLFFDTTNYRDRSDIKTPDSEYEYAKQIASGYVPNVISHVGLYVGNGMMIHAASGDGYVKYESLDKDYYKNRFINARRLIKDE